MSCNTWAMHEYTHVKTKKKLAPTSKPLNFCSHEDQDGDRDWDCLFLPRLPKKSRLPFVGQSFEIIDRHFFRRQSPSPLSTNSVPNFSVVGHMNHNKWQTIVSKYIYICTSWASLRCWHTWAWPRSTYVSTERKQFYAHPGARVWNAPTYH